MSYIPPHMRNKKQEEELKMDASTNSNLFPQLINSTADNSSKPKISFANHAAEWEMKKEESRIEKLRQSIREERLKNEEAYFKAVHPFGHFKKHRPPTAMKRSENVMNEEIKVEDTDNDGEREWTVVCHRKIKKPKIEKELSEEDFKGPSSEEEEVEEDTYWKS